MVEVSEIDLVLVCISNYADPSGSYRTILNSQRCVFLTVFSYLKISNSYYVKNFVSYFFSFFLSFAFSQFFLFSLSLDFCCLWSVLMDCQ